VSFAQKYYLFCAKGTKKAAHFYEIKRVEWVKGVKSAISTFLSLLIFLTTLNYLFYVPGVEKISTNAVEPQLNLTLTICESFLIH
jgi:hypothetical protein